MPYQILRLSNNKWVLKNKETGKVKGHHSSYVSALRQMRLLQGIEHGWKPTGRKSNLKKKKYGNKK